jgi:peptide chain release factor 2
MSSYKKQLEEIVDSLEKAKEALDLEATKARLIELEALMNEPNFWNDPNKAKVLSQEAAELKNELDQWSTIENDVKELQDVSELARKEKDNEMLKQLEADVEELEKRFRKLEFALLFSQDHDSNGAIVSIHAGAGGTDAMDWAEILVRMFMRYAESKSWSVEVIHESRGEEAGIKHMTFALRGRFVYGHMKGEAGVHRLVRISPFDAEKMRHTAFALVEVLPELDDVMEKSIELNSDDLRIDTFMSSGKGGQSVNTTYSAVRVTHLPTGLVVSCQNERSQLQNKETALRVLKSRLHKMMLEERAEKIEEIKGKHKSPEWGNQIRSYVMHPYKMVKDHRTNVETQDIDSVLSGGLDSFIEAYLRMQASSVEEKG